MEHHAPGGDAGYTAALGQVGGPLGHITGGQGAERFAVHQHLAPLNGNKTQSGLQKGAFAAAVGAQYPSDLSGREGQGNVGKDGGLAIPHKQVLHFNHGGAPLSAAEAAR